MGGLLICILLVFRSLFVVGKHITVCWRGFCLNSSFLLFLFTGSFVDIASGVVYDFSVTISLNTLINTRTAGFLTLFLTCTGNIFFFLFSTCTSSLVSRWTCFEL